MKHILIPTDFSENAQNAIKYALSFFKDGDVTFYLLHVSLMAEVDEEECYYKVPEAAQNTNVTIKPFERLTSELQSIKKRSKNTRHHFFAIHEYIQFIEAVRKHVVEKEIDFIVMGTKGASRWKRDTIGTNTGNVITKVKCPVLVIPEHARYSQVKNIVFPTDFNIFYKNRILNTFTEILQQTKASASILYISKKVQDLTPLQKKNRNYLQEHLEDKPHNSFFITDENIETAIDTFVSSHEVDMIAMVAKNLNFFQRILFKPTVEKLSYYTKIPFLVLHE
jgi:nucleotide-binding universal stress UspA family protein